MTDRSGAVALLAVGLALLNIAASAPPQNPWLAASSNPIGHSNAAQQDSVQQPGPQGPGRVLTADELGYRHLGPAHFGALTSGLYADGRRVLWSNGIDRIAKLDHETYEVLDEYFFPDTERYDPDRADASIAGFDESNEGFLAAWDAFVEMGKLRDLSNIYTLLDRDHTYYVGSKTGAITAYADADPADSRSAIVKQAVFQLPAGVSGLIIGLNMTFDGWLAVVTEHGYLVLVRRDFSDHRVIRLRHSEGAEDKATGPTGRGWVRNGIAVDRHGGIYIASQAHMHKLVWDGERLSTDPAAGAWTAAYPNPWGHGSGATPSLMGFGGEDQFVVITDGSHLMHLMLFWRNAIPEQWQGLPGASSRRVAGMLPVDMDDPDLHEIQSEQSVVVSGYGALVVNNKPRNVPWYLPGRAASLLISMLGSNPEYQPYGVQKFVWNPRQQRLEEAWVNKRISSPSCVPIVSAASDAVYLIGARDNRWTLEALDWSSGASRFHHVIGGQRYNVLFSGTLLDEGGRIHYGTPWGRVRINAAPASSAAR